MNEQPPADAQDARDNEHVRLLAIFHYIVGGLEIFFSCFGMIYVAMGLVMATSPEFFENEGPAEPPPAVLGYVISGFGGCIVLVGWALGGLTIYSGRLLQTRRRRTFSQVMAAINCLWVPVGTILGVFTLVVLARPSVMRQYEAHAP